jgi:putative molybdopterin biosynthesis protein
MAGLKERASDRLAATLPVRVNSERGRTEYLLVRLLEGPRGWTAYPMGKGSGSVTAFSRADGFVVIPRHQEFLDAGEPVEVVALGRGIVPADLVVVGSHCLGLDLVLGELADQFSSQTIWVGSQGGLTAAARGECDIAGVHLLDSATGRYNEPFVPDETRLLRGYGRMQGLLFRRGDSRFTGVGIADALAVAVADHACVMVNRNRGSGTRVLIDGLLDGRRPPGFAVEARSHNAVAAAVAQGRADWGIAISPVASAYGLGFISIRAERYDFLVPASRWDRPAVAAFRTALARPEVRHTLTGLGFQVEEQSE